MMALPVACGILWMGMSTGNRRARDEFYGCSTVVLIGVTCPAVTVATVMSACIIIDEMFNTVVLRLFLIKNDALETSPYDTSLS